MNKFTAIGALAFACASFPAHASRIERFIAIMDPLLQKIWDFAVLWVSMLGIPVIIICIGCISYVVLSEHLGRDSRAQKYLIRRSIRKYPELRAKIQEHLKSKVLTRGGLADMESTLVIESHLASEKEEKED